MPLTREQLGSLLAEALEDRAPPVDFTPEEVEAKAARLSARLADIRASTATRALVHAALAALPPERRGGWTSGVQAALKVVLATARRGSRIVASAAREILPLTPDAWSFASAAGTTARGEAIDPGRVDSVGHGDDPAVSVVIDDIGAQRRLLATIRRFPAGQPPPVLLVIEEDDDPGPARALEVDAEPEPEPGEPALRRLRYEATLPPGAYIAFLGNPRGPGR